MAKKAKKKTSKKKTGLYVNIHKAQERAKRGGKPVRKKGEKGAPTEEAFAKAAASSKKKKKKTKRKLQKNKQIPI